MSVTAKKTTTVWWPELVDDPKKPAVWTGRQAYNTHAAAEEAARQAQDLLGPAGRKLTPRAHGRSVSR